MPRILRFLLPLPFLAVAACSSERSVIPRCPPCPCIRDMAEYPPRPDMTSLPDLGDPADLSCEDKVGASCVGIPCCAGLTCVGGACAVVPAR